MKSLEISRYEWCLWLAPGHRWNEEDIRVSLTLLEHYQSKVAIGPDCKMLFAHKNVIWLGKSDGFDLNFSKLHWIALDPHYEINRTVIDRRQINVKASLCQSHRCQLFAPTHTCLI
ncbi:hypothetical protein DBIPINDM_001855 [Mesorhizobium sp. AR02]|uniref:hypothetical protein n=1 Tax=Mesorhizobium sp. AR02 TaxID=2865837 RepID=UPI00215F131F|nr:hypothetical protein [Mesorhizobium sp. AR02]UVK55348.1 hypothetical protein DBIPINDM_001855 [Mesorhizobium sp. AR02]